MFNSVILLSAAVTSGYFLLAVSAAQKLILLRMELANLETECLDHKHFKIRLHKKDVYFFNMKCQLCSWQTLLQRSHMCFKAHSASQLQPKDDFKPVETQFPFLFCLFSSPSLSVSSGELSIYHTTEAQPIMG